MRTLALALMLWLAALVPGALAQSATPSPPPGETLHLVTVTRPPFSFVENGQDTGFSIDLWQALMDDLGYQTEITRVATFGDMLDRVRAGSVDAAAANISITAQREGEMDFSQPIFEAGLRVMVPETGSRRLTWLGAVFSPELLAWVGAGLGLLLLAGMLMWVFERKREPYFDLPARKAFFPAFWWALNLVLNGGFEERQPKSAAGRVLGVILVISSLFLVSLFVARIASTMTVSAIQTNVNSVKDLYGKRVGTTSGSTSAAFLDRRDLRFEGFDDFAALIAAFEGGELDAVVFDAPILAWYAHGAGRGKAELVGPVFLRENYGIALPTGSALAEPLNQSLLRLRENGTYESIRATWFGPADG